MKTARHWTELKRTWFVVWLLDLILWCSLPSRIGNSYMSLDIHENTGKPGKVTFVIRDTDHNRVPNISVESSSYSGSTQMHFTDVNGVAEIDPSESEVLGVWIDDQGFGFENRLPGGKLLDHILGRIPQCDGGLTIHVTMRRRTP